MLLLFRCFPSSLPATSAIPHARRDLDECLGDLWKLGGRVSQSADGSAFVHSIKYVVEEGKKRKQAWEKDRHTRDSCLSREQERFPQKVETPWQCPKSALALHGDHAAFTHIIPATTAAQRAQIPLTPEEDPRQKLALKAAKKREEADNIDRRGNRGGNRNN